VLAAMSVVPTSAAQDAPVLTPTNHPRVATDPSQLWIVPSGPTSARGEFAAAVKLEVDGEFAMALPIVSRASMPQGARGAQARHRQPAEGDRRVLARPLPISVQRRCRRGEHRARFAAARADRTRLESLQAGARTCRASVRREALRAGASGLRSRPAVVPGRRS